MCALFRNRYRIGSVRYRGYDYSWPGGYFITVCTHNRIPYLGNVENGEMQLSALGNCLQREWLKIPSIRPDMNITLDEFIIMPDHFHAIIVIGENQYNQNKFRGNYHGRHAMHGVSTMTKNRGNCCNAMHDVSTNKYQNKFSPQSKNISSIMRGLKSAVTIYAKKNGLDFRWQPRYHDHIIRTYSELKRIRKYIIENPGKWDLNPKRSNIRKYK